MTQPFLLAQISDLHITAGGRLSCRVVSGLVSHIVYVGEFAGPYPFR